ncbi:unnamed protein product [Closterium sp. NIES-53]
MWTRQRQQQRQQETFSPQQLRDCVSQRGVPGCAEAAALGASESAAALDASESAAALGASASTATDPASAEALHTFTLDSSASCCFFRDCTTVTPLTAPVPVSLVDPSGGPVVARASTVLPCPAAPSGSLAGLHLPSFTTKLVSNAVLQDHFVTVTTPGGELVVICTDSRTGAHLATFTRRPGSGLYTLTTAYAQLHLARAEYSRTRISYGTTNLVTPLSSVRAACSPVSLSLASPGPCPPLPRSLAPPCLPCVKGRQHAAPHSSKFPPTTAPLLTLHIDVKADVIGVLIPWIRAARHQLRERFWQDLPVLCLHSGRGGEFSSGLLAEFCRDQGIRLMFMLPTSLQQNGIAERRIGLVMEVARTSIIHAAAPHFQWLFVVRYAAHQLNLWPRVSSPETSPTLRWTGEVGDASAFWVWGTLSLVRDTTANKLSPRTLCCAFLGFPTNAPSCSPPSRPPPPQGPAPSGVSQVDPSPLDEPVEISSDSSGPAEGGDPAAEDTVATRRSPCLETPPGFLPRPSSPPPQPAAVDSCAAAGGDTGAGASGGAGLGGADTGAETGAYGAAGAGGVAGGGGAGAASPGGTDGVGGTGGARAIGIGGAGATGAGGAGGVAGAGGVGAGGAGVVVGAGGAGAGGTRGAGAAGPRGARTGGAGAAGAGAAAGAGGAGGAPGGAGGTGAAGLGGAGATGAGGARAAGPGGACTRIAGAAGAGRAAGAGGAIGAPGTGGAGAAGSGGARGAIGTGSAGASGTGAADSTGTAPRRPFFYPQPQSSLPPPASALRQVLSLPSSTGLTPPLLCPPSGQSQPQLMLGSPLPAPTPYNEVIESLIERHEPETRASTPVRARRVLLHVAALRDYELHSLDFSTAFLQGSQISTSGMGLVLGGQGSVVLTGHSDASWVDGQATQRSSQGYTFNLGSGSVSWRSTRSSFVLGSSCEAEIYTGAMAALELRWLTYLLTDLGERPRSPPVLYVDNKAMLALCHEQRLEHRTKHIDLCYFLARELQ